MTASQQQAVIIISAAAILLLYALYLTGTGAGSGSGGGAVSCNQYTVPFTGVKADATAKAVKLFDLPAKAKIIGLTVKHSEAFAGTGGLKVTVGTNASPAVYASDFDIVQPVSDTAMHDDGGMFSATWGAHPVMATFTSAGANLSALTAGSVDVFVCMAALP